MAASHHSLIQVLSIVCLSLVHSFFSVEKPLSLLSQVHDTNDACTLWLIRIPLFQEMLAILHCFLRVSEYHVYLIQVYVFRAADE